MVPRVSGLERSHCNFSTTASVGEVEFSTKCMGVERSYSLPAAPLVMYS